MNDLPVSLYFMPEWWDRHFHGRTPRPARPSQPALEAMYLARLRFLYEQFGRWGIGEERPTRGPGQISTVIRYGFDLVPALLGTQLDLADAWGFYPRLRSLAALHSVKPVDIRGHPEGEWILREKERLERLYGRCSHCIDLGSVTNNAFRMIGEELYAELLHDPAAVESLFGTILATMSALYDFLVDHFGGMNPVPISNCNVGLMSPALYERRVLPFDARQSQFAEHRGGAPRAAVHHCDVPVDRFLPAYAKLPGLASIQAAISSDIRAAKAVAGGCAFSALVSPGYLCGDLAVFERVLRDAFAAGADDLALWNVDSQTDAEALRRAFDLIEAVACEAGRRARFTAMPLCWEEIEWAHARCAVGESSP